ncbi:S1-like domain-containing RNA-binding protein [Helicobacter sp. 13S00477-4]|uniref:CvfB family protein n=1 Tax=Helicobacter sp. 13S00477-4 TaxID=1905759 RepID=UPI000BA6B2F9|nr:S1-like domain-containing RNA-binding protein [Helicobacter sp. 13S00477-4]PAF52512.1 hypothetical protein BKH44_01655 [Helicobacter sp. 13S00477-4]
MQIGKIQTLQINRLTQHGAYLKSNDDDEEILLPNKFLSSTLDIGDFIEVFLYTDSEDRPVATTQKPFAILGQICPLKVVSIQDNGCFLDMGIDKHIFMPTKNPKRFKLNENIVIKINTDKQNRLIARLGFKESLLPFKGNGKHLKVNILPFEKTPLGIGCVVNEKYYGLLYHNQIFSPIQLGEYQNAYITNIRADGKLDLCIKSPQHLSEEKHQLLELIKDKKILELDFNSSPEIIQKICRMSKKSFKTIINTLVKESKIKILDNPKQVGKKIIQIA